MRLYSRIGATSTSHDGVVYTAGDDGAFDFPEHAGMELHRYHVAKKPMWEDEIERQQRLTAEELERRKDPASLFDAVSKIVQAAQSIAPAQPSPAGPAQDPGQRTDGAQEQEEDPAQHAEPPAKPATPAKQSRRKTPAVKPGT